MKEIKEIKKKNRRAAKNLKTRGRGGSNDSIESSGSEGDNVRVRDSSQESDLARGSMSERRGPKSRFRHKNRSNRSKTRNQKLKTASRERKRRSASKRFQRGPRTSKSRIEDRASKLLTKKQQKIAEMKRSIMQQREDKQLRECTFKPHINKRSKHKKRNVQDLMNWHKNAKSKLWQKETSSIMGRAEFTPMISEKSKEIWEHRNLTAAFSTKVEERLLERAKNKQAKIALMREKKFLELTAQFCGTGRDGEEGYGESSPPKASQRRDRSTGCNKASSSLNWCPIWDKHTKTSQMRMAGVRSKSKDSVVCGAGSKRQEVGSMSSRSHWRGKKVSRRGRNRDEELGGPSEVYGGRRRKEPSEQLSEGYGDDLDAEEDQNEGLGGDDCGEYPEDPYEQFGEATDLSGLEAYTTEYKEAKMGSGYGFSSHRPPQRRVEGQESDFELSKTSFADKRKRRSSRSRNQYFNHRSGTSSGVSNSGPSVGALCSKESLVPLKGKKSKGRMRAATRRGTERNLDSGYYRESDRLNKTQNGDGEGQERDFGYRSHKAKLGLSKRKRSSSVRENRVVRAYDKENVYKSTKSSTRKARNPSKSKIGRSKSRPKRGASRLKKRPKKSSRSVSRYKKTTKTPKSTSKKPVSSKRHKTKKSKPGDEKIEKAKNALKQLNEMLLDEFKDLGESHEDGLNDIIDSEKVQLSHESEIDSCWARLYNEDSNKEILKERKGNLVPSEGFGPSGAGGAKLADLRTPKKFGAEGYTSERLRGYKEHRGAGFDEDLVPGDGMRKKNGPNFDFNNLKEKVNFLFNRDKLGATPKRKRDGGAQNYHSLALNG